MPRRVFVVEDEPQIAKILRDYMSNAGYDVEVFGDGRSALEAFEKQHPDLILLDLMLPEVDVVSID